MALPVVLGARFQRQTNRQYFKSYFVRHNSQKVCKVLVMMTIGSMRADQPRTADDEVSGGIAAGIPPSPSNFRWYFRVVAIVRAGKPLEALGGLWQLHVGRWDYRARSAQHGRRVAALSAPQAAGISALPVPISDELAMPR